MIPRNSEPDIAPANDVALWPGFWPGTVVDDEDPDKDGRLRIRVPQLYGDDTTEAEFIPDDHLPWCRSGHFITGNKSGEAWCPPVGATVWVSLWGGNPEKPVWFGGWFTPDTVPPEFASSYAPGPMTRLIKTTNGHTIEMRWVKGQEHIYIKTAGNALLDLVDAPALGGPKIVGVLPSGRTFGVDDKLQRAFIQTPTQSVIVDDAAEAIEATSPTAIDATVGPTSVQLTDATATVTSPTVNVVGTVAANVTAPAVQVNTGGLNLNTGTAAFILPAVLTTLAFTVNAAVLMLNSLGLMTLSAVGVLSLFGSAVLIGTIAGAKHFLVDERAVALYNGHTHATPADPPDAAHQWGGVNPVLTQDTKAS